MADTIAYKKAWQELRNWLRYCVFPDAENKDDCYSKSAIRDALINKMNFLLKHYSKKSRWKL